MSPQSDVKYESWQKDFSDINLVMFISYLIFLGIGGLVGFHVCLDQSRGSKHKICLLLSGFSVWWTKTHFVEVYIPHQLPRSLWLQYVSTSPRYTYYPYVHMLPLRTHATPTYTYHPYMYMPRLIQKFFWLPLKSSTSSCPKGYLHLLTA